MDLLVSCSFSLEALRSGGAAAVNCTAVAIAGFPSMVLSWSSRELSCPLLDTSVSVHCSLPRDREKTLGQGAHVHTGSTRLWRCCFSILNSTISDVGSLHWFIGKICKWCRWIFINLSEKRKYSHRDWTPDLMAAGLFLGCGGAVCPSAVSRPG